MMIFPEKTEFRLNFQIQTGLYYSQWLSRRGGEAAGVVLVVSSHLKLGGHHWRKLWMKLRPSSLLDATTAPLRYRWLPTPCTLHPLLLCYPAAVFPYMNRRTQLKRQQQLLRCWMLVHSGSKIFDSRKMWNCIASIQHPFWSFECAYKRHIVILILSIYGKSWAENVCQMSKCTIKEIHKIVAP